MKFIYCARLLRTKGIEIFCELSERKKQGTWIAYGNMDNAAKDSLNEEDMRLMKGKYKSVVFKGKVKDPLLRKDDDKMEVLIIPSSYGEGMPRAIIEAMALGIPVICNKTATVGLFNEDELYISEDNTIESYEEAIRKIEIDWKDGILEEKLRNARRKAETMSENNIVKKTIELYESAVKEHDSLHYVNRVEAKTRDWIST